MLNFLKKWFFNTEKGTSDSDVPYKINSPIVEEIKIEENLKIDKKITENKKSSSSPKRRGRKPKNVDSNKS